MDYKKEMVSGTYHFTTDKTMIDIAYVHNFLSTKSYWALGIPAAVVRRSIENSLCAAVFDQDRQVGFARVVTDFATFGYLADVFVDENYRGQGLSKKLVEFVLSVDGLSGLRRIVLATRDAHGLYERFGFRALAQPDTFMEFHNPGVYGLTITLDHDRIQENKKNNHHEASKARRI